MVQRMVFEALRLMVPQDVVGVGKIRIGGPGDGGYVMLDQMDPAQPVMSFGIGPSVTFDLEMAELGHDIFMYDHTIDALPGEHPRFNWRREGVSGFTQPTRQLFSLADHMARLPVGRPDPILKMDVEGAEWEALGRASPRTLARFTQITLELHELNRLEEPGYNAAFQRMLANLAIHHAPVHAHANNFGDVAWVGGFPTATTMELTYVRRDLVTLAPSATLYPTPFDTPNFDEKPEILLWFYPFVPGSAAMEFPGSS